MSYFTATNDFKEGTGGGVQTGAYFYKVVRAEDKDNKRLTIDIDLYDIGDKGAKGTIKFISFNIAHEIGQGQLSAMMKTAGVATLNAPTDLVGKGGVVIVGQEQKWDDKTKFFPQVGFGGFGCWFSKDKLSATEMKDGKKEVEAFTERLSSIIIAPYRVGNEQLPVKPMASTARAIANTAANDEESMPF